MGGNYDFEKMIIAIVDGESEDAVALVKEALDAGVEAYEIIDSGLVKGMNIVSDKYDRKQYFVPDLAASAEAMTEALEQLKPYLDVAKEKTKGIVVLGVVKECSQEIGKNIVSAMLSGGGFRVYDLGINVSPEQFVEKAKEVKADIIAMGSPMLQTMKYFGETANLLKTEGMRKQVKVLIGGAATSASSVEKFGADAWAKDAAESIKVAEELISQLKEGK